MILQLCSWLRHPMITKSVPGSPLHCPRLVLLAQREGDAEDVAVVLHEVHLQALRDERGQVRKVLSVLGRQDDAGDTCSLGLQEQSVSRVLDSAPRGDVG